jgi:hypothetical protein
MNAMTQICRNISVETGVMMRCDNNNIVVTTFPDIQVFDRKFNYPALHVSIGGSRCQRNFLQNNKLLPVIDGRST